MYALPLKNSTPSRKSVENIAIRLSVIQNHFPPH